MDSDSKLCINYLVGTRGNESANSFVRDTASRLADRVQLTSDGYKPYIEAVEQAFYGKVDYAMLIKSYASAGAEGEKKYSPAVCTGCQAKPLAGEPDPAHISTSYVERQNLTLRMGQRRFTRLTNGFSKKLENHAHAVALHYFHYNFIRRHQTLKTTPAVAAGIASKVLSVADLVRMMEEEESKLGERITNYLPSPSKRDSK